MPDVSLIMATDPYGRVLFGKRNDNGRYTLAGGHSNEGESPEDCAIRELHEETGLTPKSLSYMRSQPLPDRSGTLHCFSALVDGKPHGRFDPDNECDKWKFVDVRNGIPANIWNKLHGPQDIDSNVVKQSFDMKKSQYNWNWESGFADLSKKIDPEHLGNIDGQTDWLNHSGLQSTAPKAIEPHIKHFESHVKSPDTTPAKHLGGKNEFNGVEAKAVLKHDDKKYMIKPVDTSWPEMASQAVFHAAGLGHMHQIVHHSETSPGKYHSVIHMEKGVPLSELENNRSNRERYHGIMTLLDGRHKNDMARMALLDAFNGNGDRHTGNLLIREDGSPLAIGHGHAFGYSRGYPGKAKDILDLHNNDIVDHGNFKQHKDWWDQHKHNILNAGLAVAQHINNDRRRAIVENGMKDRWDEINDLMNGTDDKSLSDYISEAPTGNGGSDQQTGNSPLQNEPKKFPLQNAPKQFPLGKHELGTDITPTDRLMQHPHYLERVLAIKGQGAEPKHFFMAALDPDVRVFNEALAINPHLVLPTVCSHLWDSSGLPLIDRHKEIVKDLDHKNFKELHDTYQNHYNDLNNDQWAFLNGLAFDGRHKFIESELKKSEEAQKHLSSGSASPEKKPGNDGHMKFNEIDGAHIHEPASSEPHVEAYHKEVLQNNKPGKVFGKYSDMSPKAIYEAGDHKLMVKPYYEQDCPLSGWSEATSQALYGAGGIGHLHQQSFVSKHGQGRDQIPAVVIKMEKGKVLGEQPEAIVNHVNRGNGPESRDLAKIRLMDILQNNDDRHNHNILQHEDGRLMAIDNALGFDQMTREHRPGIHAIRIVNQNPEAMKDALRWWKTAKEPIMSKFNERLEMLPTSEKRDTLHKNFHTAADFLTRIANKIDEPHDPHFAQELVHPKAPERQSWSDFYRTLTKP